MNESRPIRSEPWEYVMTAQETQSWHEANAERRRELLTDLGGRVMFEAVDHGCNRFVIYDTDGAMVARGRVQAPDIRQELEAYRRQDRRN
jgi:hypothetical protein